MTFTHFMQRIRKPFAAILLALGLIACQSVQTTEPGAIGITRKQKMAISAEEVEQASALGYAEMLQEAYQAGKLNANAAHTRRVRAIADRLIAQTIVFRPDAAQWQWQVNTVQDDSVNALCMAGGKILVFSGLIDRLKPTDDELAAVIGHEIAHALREHVREQASEQQGLGLAALVIGLATNNGAIADASSRVLELYGLKHSRRDEIEADLMGLELSARAGYDPRAAITLWDKMAALGQARPPEFLSTHPDPENRQATLAENAQKVMPLYQAAIAQRAGKKQR